MTIAELLRPEDVLADLEASDREGVLHELAEHLASRHPGVRQRDLEQVLVERERLGSTAMGEGVAIPHGKLPKLAKLLTCFGRSRRGVDFGAAGGAPTYLFFVVVAPAKSPGEHLKALSQISRVFRDEGVRKRLLAAETAGEIYRILIDGKPS